MAVIGKRDGDAGLKDLAVESGVIAEGPITGVLDGKKYNRAVRLHKLVYEALLWTAWQGFYPWLEEHHLLELPKLNEAIVELEKLRNKLSQDQLNDVLLHPSCARIFQVFHTYLTFPGNENGNLFKFWMGYIDMVEIVLGLIRASHEGNLLLHLANIS